LFSGGLNWGEIGSEKRYSQIGTVKIGLQISDKKASLANIQRSDYLKNVAI
jgi:hypothetical protein